MTAVLVAPLTAHMHWANQQNTSFSCICHIKICTMNGEKSKYIISHANKIPTLAERKVDLVESFLIAVDYWWSDLWFVTRMGCTKMTVTVCISKVP